VFETAGTYTVRCTVSSPTASDSPKTQTTTVTVT
jgi:PKD repeat protein